MERNESDTERGQVGIGTLIVFIAMVLVAAIAAGVLINTAGFLQTQAEDTGEGSTEQVADNLNVITEVGEVGPVVGENITEVRIGVQPAAGANDINLADLTVQLVSDDQFANIVVGNETTGSVWEQAEGDTPPGQVNATADPVNGTQYGVDVVTAENENDLVMTDNADRYEIVIPTNGSLASNDGNLADNNLDALSEGESVELTITTDVGSQTVAFLQVPDSLSGEDPSTTVNL